MTQKLDSSKKSGEEILQTIEPKGIADESMRRTVEILLNLIEQLQAEVKELRAENQQLKDDFNRLKGEQGKPDIKANKKEFINNQSMAYATLRYQRKSEKSQKSIAKAVRTRLLK
jgi:hypothetical protein